MLSFISFILVCVGSLNWFSIGILQYDFVAGLFGSQSNIFSRIVYTLVGIASIVVIANLIKNKGKFIVSFKKASSEYEKLMEEQEENRKSRVMARAESGEDNSIDKDAHNCDSKSSSSNCNKSKCDCDKDK